MPGLFLGCLAANLLSPYGALDIIFGSLATLLAALWTQHCRRKWMAPLPPVICNAVIVGAGVTGRALAMGLMEAGAFDVALANRTPREGILQIDSPLCRELVKRVEILINATPLGLRKHDPCFAAKGLFDCKHTVFDTAPSNLLNGSCREAFVARARYIGGAGALVRRCAAAFEIWAGSKADVPAMSAAVSEKGDDES